MLLIYVDRLTNRLGYTLNLVFEDILGIKYSITNNKKDFSSHEGFKLSYSKKKISDEFFIYSKELLFETIIEDKFIECFNSNGFPAIFKTYSKSSELNFDVFASIFYFVSRYEEYLPYIQDSHGRFRPQESFAYKNGFLNKPIVNIWAKHLEEKLKSFYPDLQIDNPKVFRFLNTIDVDSAYSVLEKSWLRIGWGMLRDLFRGDLSEILYKIKVIRKKEKDPFDNFNYLITLMTKYNLKTIFFILFGRYGKYDKNISSENIKFQQLIKNLCDYAKVGVHPSYSSYDEPELLKYQLKKLRSVINKPIYRSRFHYLRFSLPNSFRVLIENKITEDFSMGYSASTGFRAGISNGFNFYDLEYDYETKLRLFPFVIMDTALKTYLKLSPQEAISQIKNLIDEVRSVDGYFISLWHNESLSNRYDWKGWKEVYEWMIEYISKFDRIELNKREI